MPSPLGRLVQEVGHSESGSRHRLDHVPPITVPRRSFSYETKQRD